MFVCLYGDDKLHLDNIAVSPRDEPVVLHEVLVVVTTVTNKQLLSLSEVSESS